MRILPNYESLKNRLYRIYKRNAKNRNLSFELSKDVFNDLIFNHNCYYCNAEPELFESDKAYTNGEIPPKHHGIDRLDSNKGYTADNCVTCCEYCNRMKLDKSQQEFLKKVTEIYRYRIKKGSETIEKTSEEDGTE